MGAPRAPTSGCWGTPAPPCTDDPIRENKKTVRWELFPGYISFTVHNLLFPAENHAILDVLFQLRGMMSTTTVPVEQRNAVHGVLVQVERSAVHGVLFSTKRNAVHGVAFLAYKAYVLLFAAHSMINACTWLGK
jgi:hypothetical protein